MSSSPHKDVTVKVRAELGSMARPVFGCLNNVHKAYDDRRVGQIRAESHKVRLRWQITGIQWKTAMNN